jgi:hypothetical protein
LSSFFNMFMKRVVEHVNAEVRRNTHPSSRKPPQEAGCRDIRSGLSTTSRQNSRGKRAVDSSFVNPFSAREGMSREAG